ncbi:hypothetical protein [Futiania mangrovi]|uniref:Uncharacterized protein n=1 Tax=Futiania mangrovi TaxID=2959716 RepID=A0A9J6P8V3_9PROT|nr:hypothetical protein [Futiania mangrovii]MCP1336220.1 hypothetical protein [Futiania mangrovii]
MMAGRLRTPAAGVWLALGAGAWLGAGLAALIAAGSLPAADVAALGRAGAAPLAARWETLLPVVLWLMLAWQVLAASGRPLWHGAALMALVTLNPVLLYGGLGTPGGAWTMLATLLLLDGLARLDRDEGQAGWLLVAGGAALLPPAGPAGLALGLALLPAALLAGHRGPGVPAALALLTVPMATTALFVGYGAWVTEAGGVDPALAGRLWLPPLPAPETAMAAGAGALAAAPVVPVAMLLRGRDLPRLALLAPFAAVIWASDGGAETLAAAFGALASASVAALAADERTRFGALLTTGACVAGTAVAWTVVLRGM